MTTKEEARLISVVYRASPFQRALLYGFGGLLGETAFTAICDSVKGRDRRLIGRTSLWMFPVYAALQPGLGPLTDLLRGRLPVPLRATIYGLAILGAERAAAGMIQAAGGEVPWDYRHSRWSRCGGAIRLDYLPLWMLVGLAFERVHMRRISVQR